MTKTRSPRLQNMLLILAVLGAFAAFDALAHRSSPYFLPELVIALSLSAGGLWFSQSREALDIFLIVIAAVLALSTVATIGGGDRTHVDTWIYAGVFATVGALLVLLTRARRAGLLAIAAIVAFRLVIAGFVHTFAH